MLRPFFTETPYAAALCPNLLLKHCSGCFGKIKNNDGDNDQWRCPQCQKVTYCGEKCRTDDQRWHECECAAFRTNRRPKSQSMELDIRLLARLIRRYQTDGGVAVLTSPGFPSHLVKDRRLDDFLSHERDYKKKASFEKETESMLNAFFDFFKSTPVQSVKRDVVKRWNCAATINGFSVTALTTPGSPDSMTYLGETVYLNASRFNHSCRPSMVFGFEGCRLVVKIVDPDGSGAKSPSTSSLKKKQFKAMTFNYGFGNGWNYACSYSTTVQRVESLESRYFFKCRCESCRDKTTDSIQTNGATVECWKCQQPYVWQCEKRSAKLTKTCRCASDRSITDKKHWSRQEDVRTTAKILNDQWKITMDEIQYSRDADLIIEKCEKLRSYLVQYWNRSHNVRLAQLCEREFEAYWKKTFPRDAKEGDEPAVDPQFQETLGKMLELAEIMMGPYLRFGEPYNLCISVLCHRIGSLYRMYEHEDAAQRGSAYFLIAGEIWSKQGEPKCQQHFVEMSQRLLNRAAAKSSTKAAEEESIPVMVPV